MIVVDTNVIAYFVIPGDETELAEAVWAKDSTWAAPSLWRSEMRNLLSLYVKREKFDLLDANEFIADATNLLEGNEFGVESHCVLELASRSGCSAYDCEFVSIAERLGVPLVTSDKKLLAAFPDIAVSMKAFAA